MHAGGAALLGRAGAAPSFSRVLGPIPVLPTVTHASVNKCTWEPLPSGGEQKGVGAGNGGLHTPGCQRGLRKPRARRPTAPQRLCA